MTPSSQTAGTGAALKQTRRRQPAQSPRWTHLRTWRQAGQGVAVPAATAV